MNHVSDGKRIETECHFDFVKFLRRRIHGIQPGNAIL